MFEDCFQEFVYIAVAVTQATEGTHVEFVIWFGIIQVSLLPNLHVWVAASL